MSLLNPLSEVLIGILLDHCEQLSPSSFVPIRLTKQLIAINGSTEHFA